MSDDWTKKVEEMAKSFAAKHAATYSLPDRKLFAAFEIGCFLSIVRFYENQGFSCTPTNLNDLGEYTYLTSPNGNPANFSYVAAASFDGNCEIRQQVRVRSHLHPDIAFTPDIIVVRSEPALESAVDAEYANGKRRFFFVETSQVIAAHECKSTQPFPELLISFVGMLLAAHPWIDRSDDRSLVSPSGPHLAPTLFVGGSARSLHLRMVRALRLVYPMNAVLGMHYGTWELTSPAEALTRIQWPTLQAPPSSMR